jgi:hypothetical protein
MSDVSSFVSKYALDAAALYKLIGFDGNAYIYDTIEQDGKRLALVHSRNHRGTVIDVSDYKIVCPSYPTSYEYIAQTYDFRNSISGYQFCPLYEGMLIRIFYWQGQWQTTGHYSLTMDSQILRDVWGNSPFDEYLDRSKYYLFILSHPNTRLVSIPTMQLYLLPLSSGTLIKPHPNIKILKFSKMTIREYNRWFETVPWNVSYGMIAITPLNKYIRLVNSIYRDKKTIRGSEPNLLLRFVQLHPKYSNELANMYPEKRAEFEELAQGLNTLAAFLYRAYIKRYVEKQFVYLPIECHYIVSVVYEQVRKSRHTASVYDMIEKVLKTSTPRQLYNIYQTSKNELLLIK